MLGDDACLLILLCYGPHAQANYKAQLEPMLMQYVVPAFSAPVGHLRAKACWVTQQYADIRFAAGRGRGPSFQQLFQKTLGLLADPELPVCTPSVSQSITCLMRHVACCMP